MEEERAAGYAPHELLAGGVSLHEMHEMGVAACSLLGGTTQQQPVAASHELSEWRAAGYSAIDLKLAGKSAAELLRAGFTPRELVDAGFSQGELAAVHVIVGPDGAIRQTQ